MTAVHSGQKLKIPATDWNDLGDILTQWKFGGRVLRDSFGRDDPLPYGWCWIKNNTGSPLLFGAVLGIDSPLISPVGFPDAMYEGFHFYGVTPSTSTPHYGKYAVLQEPADAGGVRRAVYHGIAWASLSITHAADLACEIANGVTASLTTGYCGTSRILWKDSSLSGGLIRIGDALDNFVGKADGSISASGGTGTVSVWDAAFGGDLGNNITGCYNNTATGISSGDRVAGCVIQGIPVISKLC